jgi:nicotinamide-nucleotide amidase
LLTPDHVDTNSLFLTEKLNQAGFEVHIKTVVGDNECDIGNVLRSALGRSVVIVLSGGLGPTEDDLTRPAVARVLGRQIRIDPDVLGAIRERFAGRGIRMAATNERQAQVIDGAEVLGNPLGTAPGMWIENGDARIVLLPGPPRELKPMFEVQVLPRIAGLGGGRILVRQSFRVTGMTESEVDSLIAPIYKTHGVVQTTILAASGYIGIRLYQWVSSGAEANELREIAAGIRVKLGNAIFTSSEESLDEVVGKLLRESGQTLAIAESCTSGMIGMRITRVPGSSDYFVGGVLCYANEVKERLCGVPAEIVLKHGAVSAEAAEALAIGVKAALHSSIGLSITGIAGPGGGTKEKPVGLVYVGLADGRRLLHEKRIIPGDREAVRERAAAFAISLLRNFLMAGKIHPTG